MSSRGYKRNRSRSIGPTVGRHTLQQEEPPDAAPKPLIAITDTVAMKMGDWLYKMTKSSDESCIVRTLHKDVVWILGCKFDFTLLDAYVQLNAADHCIEALSASPLSSLPSLLAGKTVIDDIKHTLSSVAPVLSSSSKQIFNSIKETLHGSDAWRDDEQSQNRSYAMESNKTRRATTSKPIPVPYSSHASQKYRHPYRSASDVVSLHDSGSLANSSTGTDGDSSIISEDNLISVSHNRAMIDARVEGKRSGAHQINENNNSHNSNDAILLFGTSPHTAKEYDIITQTSDGQHRKISTSLSPPSDLDDFLCNEPECTWKSSTDSLFLESTPNKAIKNNLTDTDLGESHVFIDSLPRHTTTTDRWAQEKGATPMLYTIESSITDPELNMISRIPNSTNSPRRRQSTGQGDPLSYTHASSLSFMTDINIKDEDFVSLDEHGDEDYGLDDRTELFEITSTTSTATPAAIKKLHSTVKAMLDMWQSRVWFTYRSGLHHSIGGTRYLSDTGWGCMHRTGQSLLCEAFMRLRFGKGFSWSRLCRDNTLHRDYQAILGMFEDTPQATFSIYHIAMMGTMLDKRIGEWFSPGIVAHALSRINQSLPRSPLRIYIATDTILSVSQIIPNSEKRHDQDGVHSSVWNPVLVLVPVRLGTVSFNETYLDNLFDLFEWPYCVGIAGGRKDASLYFAGYRQSDKHLLYYDPHVPQMYSPLIGCKPPYESYHTSTIRALSPRNLDPSMLLGFLICSKLEFEDFVSRTQQWRDHPLFMCSETDDVWDVDENFGVLTWSDDDGEDEWVVTGQQ